MIDVNQLRKGVTYEHDNNLWRVLEYSHVKPGRGKATIRTKVRNLRSGSTVEHTFNSGERVQDIRLDNRTVQFLYQEDNLVYFMDMETYEQPVLNYAVVEDVMPYLKEGSELQLKMYGDEAIDVELPPNLDLEVVEAEVAVRGDTSGAVTKAVKLETGLVVNVPAFVTVGTVIRVDTRSGEYLTRV